MNFVTVLTVFVIIFVAEIPDKTMVSSILLGSKYNGLLVWLGAAFAFAIQVTISVTVGTVITLIPHNILEGIIAAVFLAGGIYLILTNEKEQIEEGEKLAQTPKKHMRKVLLTSFGVTFLGEFGDLTQIATINLEAKYHQALSVALGAFLGLVAVVSIGIIGGKSLLKVLPTNRIRKLAGIIFIGFFFYDLYSIFR